ncbi:cobalamin biosynthesis protein cobalt-precorrin-6A biosynthesis protein CbiD [Acetobacter estunensis NRIC 0472]|uniref:Cobalt-precorrin-5B C(1)-methyltransferase n=1 Tax=Acetobacter estunensis TaxID=104097 RepID=A0A967B7V2_9PROT|nr:cobalt-precorrin-5B (C(1))-methyltransferase [Acetobacter estunensis]NHO53786.1 cobalt-precorrin-5B (C(1))-methyltransferase [Acetobacter estunensis]GBQ20052.1 cobalamin biosynthesis protein cobalt-precorrin-6A biosynthesis protein CbiD [Acetobacter estunensis NRIC 0472]
MNAPSPHLRSGWTTGSCATAAAKAAWTTLCTGHTPDPVTITLPGGKQVAFALADHGLTPNGAWAAVVKDAGDDPDVTHGALIRADVMALPPSSGITFHAGAGVGTVTRPGLPIPPGEPAINPVPRAMIRTALEEVSGPTPDASVTISIANGEELAQRTLNGRLGIVGGLSVLGTTGIVVPFSCSAWIDSIRRGIDVARAMHLPHLAASTGNVSERSVQALFNLPDAALIEMGDFAGGVLKYVRDHPVPRLTIAGGIAKMTKLAQGRLDLHSKRGLTDMDALAKLAKESGADNALAQRISTIPTVAEAFLLTTNAGLNLGDAIARQARNVALDVLNGAPTALDVLVFDRAGQCVGQAMDQGWSLDAPHEGQDRKRR